MRDLVGRENFGRANGVLNVFRGLAAIIGPIIAGFIYDKTNLIFYPFLFIGCLFFAAFTFSLAASVRFKVNFLLKKWRNRGLSTFKSANNFKPTTQVEEVE